jgi:hypothetical protein
MWWRVHGNAADPIAVARVENGGEGPIQARAGLKPAPTSSATVTLPLRSRPASQL